MANKKTPNEPIVEEVIETPNEPLRHATPAEQVAYNEARRAAVAQGLVPPAPPEGVIFDSNVAE